MPPPVFRFADFEIDVFRHELRHSGRLVTLQRMPCELLVLLVANHDRVVTREEITGQLWGEDRFIDSERSINTAIRKIRSALGDDPDQSRFVRTVVGKGYQFIASVEQSSGDAEPAAEAPVQAEPAMPSPSAGWPRLAAISLVMLLLAAVGAALFAKFRNQPKLTDRDTILLSDFANQTGDPLFDLTLKEGLAVQLEQSPLLSILPDERVRETLRMMRRSPDERITTDIAREICQRQGLKALITGLITPLGSHYAITLEATDSRTGDTLARVQVEAGKKEQVLQALSEAASRLRGGLGESVRSIRKFDALLEHTTTSLEALRAYSLGLHERIRGNVPEAISFYRHAIELDPNFVFAYAALAFIYSNTRQSGLTAEYATRAYELRDRVSERERLSIMALYYGQVTGELNKRIEVLRLHQESYPRDAGPHSNLAATYNSVGQFEQAVEESRTAIRLSTRGAARYAVLGNALIHLNRFPEAGEVYRQALEQQLDSVSFHQGLFRMAFANGDGPPVEPQLEWAEGKKLEYNGLDWQAEAAASRGQWRRSVEYSRRAMDAASRSEAADLAAGFAVQTALRGAAVGKCADVKTAASQALSIERNPISFTRGALALAWCGEARDAAPLIDEMSRRYPAHVIVNEIWLPVIRAAMDLRLGSAERAVESLKPAQRYEAAAEFWPQYLRGQAYLDLQKPNEAEAEFRKIIDHRGQDLLSPLYSLARFALARAAARKGDTAGARKSYQDFLAQWKDADPDLPVLIEAKKALEDQR